MKKRLLYVINVDWYFCLHWLARARAAQKAGYEVHVATRITDSQHHLVMSAQGFYVHPIHLGRKSINPYQELRSKREISMLIKAVSPALVHAITVKPNIYAGAACRKLNIPCVMTVAGLGSVFSSGGWKKGLAKRIIAREYRRVLRNNHQARLIFENQDDAEFFITQRLATAAQINVIPGAGVDIRQFAYHPPREALPPYRVLFAARLLWDKGLAELIEAMEIMRGKGLAVELLVAGIVDHDNSNAIPLRQVEQWHAEQKINWLGQIKAMAELIASADVVALPTTYGEGVPRILIEAAAIGRPIVATDVTGCRDIVKSGVNGVLVAPRNIEALADALVVLLKQPSLCVQLGMAGRRHVESNFCQKKVIAKTLDIYNKMS
jgi:Glycosyltransferase